MRLVLKPEQSIGYCCVQHTMAQIVHIAAKNFPTIFEDVTEHDQSDYYGIDDFERGNRNGGSLNGRKMKLGAG